MTTLLFQRNFGLLWFAGLISIAGDRMLHVALPLYIYTETGSILATSVMGLAMYIPTIVLGPVAGVLVDRWDRRSVMVWANVIRAAALTLLFAIDIADNLWAVYALAAFESGLGSFFEPAENALLPQLVAENQLVQANALNSLNNNLALLIGPAFGGVLFASAGLPGVALMDAATYLIGGALIAGIRVDGKAVQETNEVSRLRAPRMWREFREGIHLIVSSRILVVLCVMAMMGALGGGLIEPLTVPFLRDILNGSDEYIGVYFSIQAVGGLLGGFLFSKFGGRWAPVAVIGFGAVIQGSLDLVKFVAPTVLPPTFPVQEFVLVLVVAFGIPSIGYFATYTSQVQQHTPDAYRGRVFSTIASLNSIVYLGSLALAGLAGPRFGIVPVMSVAGVLRIGMGVIAFLFLPRSLKKARA